jgi:hypothetical protein
VVNDERLASLEAQVAALREELADLRAAVRPAALREPPKESASAPPPRPSLSDRLHSGGTISGDELESLVGRYGTVALAATVLLMAVGAVIKMAVQRGLLTPEVRVIAGGVAAAALAGAGLFFRRRGDVRYGGMLLALSLAVVDLVAWGAGPRFHLIPTVAALVIVDAVALALATLALHDESEFLFAVSVAGALSAPFVTSDGGGTPLALLLYGGTVLAGALRAARDPAWSRAFAVLVIGALVYALAAVALPTSTASWYGPYLIAMFGAACAAGALLLGEPEWRGELPRAYLAMVLIGVASGWDIVPVRPLPMTMAVGLTMAAVTYAALLVRGVPARLWTASAVLLPLVSLSLPYAGARSGATEGAIIALWVVFALVASTIEAGREDATREGAHLLAAGILGFFAVTAWLWSDPLLFVAGLAAWGIVLAGLSRNSRSPLPLIGVALVIGAAVLSAIDQLASRAAYSFTPFATRSSASALSAAVGIALAALVLAAGRGRAAELADRPVRLGVLIGFLILWGRMEVAHAFTPDLGSFLLTSYYAACGVASIVVGRQLGIGRLRVAGLALAIYAAVKAVVEVTNIGSIALRVGAYAAVGVFLLGAGYLYRERRQSAAEVMA